MAPTYPAKPPNTFSSHRFVAERLSKLPRNEVSGSARLIEVYNGGPRLRSQKPREGSLWILGFGVARGLETGFLIFDGDGVAKAYASSVWQRSRTRLTFVQVFNGDKHVAIETLNECRTRPANVTTTIRVFVCCSLGLFDVRAGRVQHLFKFSMAKDTSPSKT